MVGTCTADLCELPGCGAASSMQPDGSIVGRCTLRLGEVRYRLTVKVDPLKSGPIFRLERPNHCADAGTQIRFNFCLVGQRSFRRELLVGAAASIIPSVVIDQGVPQHPVEPSDDAFRILDLLALFERARVSRLKNVLGRCRIPNSAREEIEKLRSMLQKLRKGCIRFRGNCLNTLLRSHVLQRDSPQWEWS